MGFLKDKIKESLVAFIAVILLFSGAWYYLDQKRLEVEKDKQELIRLQLNMESVLKN